MKRIVDPKTAASEAKGQRSTNHPFTIFALDQNHRVVRQESAAGFTCARKSAPKPLDGAQTVLAAVFGSKDRVPAKFRDQFKRVRIGNREEECFVVTG